MPNQAYNAISKQQLKIDYKKDIGVKFYANLCMKFVIFLKVYFGITIFLKTLL